jgi:hypothetical protein
MIFTDLAAKYNLSIELEMTFTIPNCSNDVNYFAFLLRGFADAILTDVSTKYCNGCGRLTTSFKSGCLQNTTVARRKRQATTADTTVMLIALTDFP